MVHSCSLARVRSSGLVAHASIPSLVLNPAFSANGSFSEASNNAVGGYARRETRAGPIRQQVGLSVGPGPLLDEVHVDVPICYLWVPGQN